MTGFKKIVYSFILASVICTGKSNAQVSAVPANYILWKGVKIYEFEYAGYSDTLETCGGEWMAKGKAENLDGLRKSTLNKIIRPAKKSNCFIVYVDLKNFWGAKDEGSGGIYCLGLMPKLK